MRRIAIAVLVGIPLLLVAAYFATLVFFYCDSDDQGFKDFCGETDVVRDDLVQFYKNRKDYPAYSLDELQQKGAFDGSARTYWVYFTPFSSATRDDQIVLRMGCGLCLIPQLCDFSFTKYDLTHDLPGISSPWKDRLEDIKEQQIEALVSKHPGAHIFSAFAWLDGDMTTDPHAELIIAYSEPGQTATKEIQYDLSQKGDVWIVGHSRALR